MNPVLLRVTDGEILIFQTMLFCNRSPNYLQIFVKISEWEVPLFLKSDNGDIFQIFSILAIVTDK